MHDTKSPKPNPASANPHRSAIRPGEPSACALVCFHGIVGSPLQFQPWIARLSPSTPYYNYLLPGHGGSPGDFARSGIKLWQAFVDKKLDELHRRHKALVVLTHSMGGLLALDYYRRRSERPKRLLMLALPLFLHLRPLAFTQGFSVLWKKKGGDVILRTAKTVYSIQSGPPYSYLGWLPRQIELWLKIRKLRKHVASAPASSLILLGDQDEWVSLKTLRFAESRGLSGLSLAGATHVYYPEQAVEQVLSLLLAALAEPGAI